MSAGPASARFRLRPLAATDMGPLTDLWVAAWAATIPAIDFDGRREWLVEHLQALGRGGATVLVAEADHGRLAGFVTIDAVSGDLDQLTVDRAYWGTGAAEALLAAAQRFAPGGITLAVNQDNPRALRFYERNGFVPVGEGVNPRSGLKTLKLRWGPDGSTSRAE